jgi:hypothetical protein
MFALFNKLYIYIDLIVCNNGDGIKLGLKMNSLYIICENDQNSMF